MTSPSCPHCQSSHRQPKWGFTACGSQMHRCQDCRRTYTPEPKAPGHPAALRQQAVRMSLDGLNQRRIGRLLGVNPQSVANWLKAYHVLLTERHPATPPPTHSGTAELDELFTFVGSKKVAPTSARR